MKHEATRELFAYWNGLRGARTAPDRCDIDPTAIRAILPDTFMLDVADDFPIRVAGTRVGALLGAGGRGGFLDRWQEHERHNLAAVLDAVVDGASPIVVGAAGAPSGRPPCAFELLFLPLRHFGKTHSRILGIVTPAQAPHWLGLAPLAPLAIRSLRVIAPEEMAQPARTAPAEGMRRAAHRDADLRGLASPPRGSAAGPANRPPVRRPALRLIEGGLAG